MSVAARKPGLTAIEVDVSDRVAEQLTRSAQARNMSVEQLIVLAAELFVDQQDAAADEWSSDDISAIERGMIQEERGEFIDQEDMMARLKIKYGG